MVLKGVGSVLSVYGVLVSRHDVTRAPRTASESKVSTAESSRTGHTAYLTAVDGVLGTLDGAVG